MPLLYFIIIFHISPTLNAVFKGEKPVAALITIPFPPIGRYIMKRHQSSGCNILAGTLRVKMISLKVKTPLSRLGTYLFLFPHLLSFFSLYYTHKMRSFLQLLILAAGLSQATAIPVLSRAAGAAKNLIIL
jgi:hypothetical protein